MPAILCHRAPPLLGVCQCVNVPKTSCFFSLQYFDSVWGQKESETVEEKFKTVRVVVVDLGPSGYPGEKHLHLVENSLIFSTESNQSCAAPSVPWYSHVSRILA